MKVKFYAIAAFILCSDMAAPAQQSFLDGEAVFKNDEVVFHQIDEHTWVGTGNLVYNESLYLVEGTEKAVLIDAGTRIKDLDKIVATITKKPIMLVATHVHNDHTGSAVDRFPEIYINPGDKDYIPQVMPRYKGNIKFLTDGEEIDLGGRKLEVVFTPGHTPGSTTFIDKNAAYGFSGDSFGSGNLLLSMDFSTLIATCERMSTIMENYGIKFLFPGHYYGNNAETKQRVDDMITLSKDVISGKVKGEKKSNGMMGLNLVITDYGVNINYSEKSIK
ncbi:MAG TPA: MBL fold metallo-hydrolase [Bacteroidales bacterium]|nr:MBL fold metallo-hydrolase [Bacteroidales bacterium]HNX83493.1 MBL fold metallo-hydrolase [Bacteroidales bacterium]HOB85138.1 MBL fold metallo-hydrolase [Bacteroidales bacterium]HPS97129.1 MBL fold metallo-hydrolase [Bacteroidales bacterium]